MVKFALFALVCIILLGVAGGIYFFKDHPVPVVDTRKWVSAGHTDAQGNFVQTGVFQMPEPVKFKEDGISHIPEYAIQLCDAAYPEASLIISSLDGMRSCLFMRKGADVVVMEDIMLAPPGQADPKHGQRVRSLFKALGIVESSDVIHEYNGVPDAMEDLEYRIGHDPAKVAGVIKRLLKEVYSVTETEGLQFEFEKERPRAQKGADRFIFPAR